MIKSLDIEKCEVLIDVHAVLTSKTDNRSAILNKGDGFIGTHVHRFHDVTHGYNSRSWPTCLTVKINWTGTVFDEVHSILYLEWKGNKRLPFWKMKNFFWLLHLFKKIITKFQFLSHKINITPKNKKINNVS